jgi:hypothetical protein
MGGVARAQSKLRWRMRKIFHDHRGIETHDHFFVVNLRTGRAQGIAATGLEKTHALFPEHVQ